MFEKKLENMTIAILTTDGFEQSELMKPKDTLENNGAEVHVISPSGKSVKAWDKDDWGKTVSVDKNLNETSIEDYDALILPGGVINPDKLRANNEAVQFVKDFLNQGKLVAAICHGPQLLIETGALHGLTLTSWPSLKTDIKNAGANWLDKEVVFDRNIITSRKPEDIPTFNKKIIEELTKPSASGNIISSDKTRHSTNGDTRALLS